MSKKFILIAVIAIFFIAGCKKQVNDNFATGNTEVQMSPTEKKVQSFIKTYAQRKNSNIKSEGDMINIEEAKALWDLTMNYAYGHPFDDFEGNCMDTVYISLPNMDNNMISESDVYKTFTDIWEAARDAFLELELEEKVPKDFMFNIISDGTKNDGKKIEVIMTSGNIGISPPIDPPQLHPGWKWGWKLGDCTDNHVSYGIKDATDIINKKIDDYDNQHQEPIPPGYKRRVTNITGSYYAQYYSFFYSYPIYNPWLFHVDTITHADAFETCISNSDIQAFYELYSYETHSHLGYTIRALDSTGSYYTSFCSPKVYYSETDPSIITISHDLRGFVAVCYLVVDPLYPISIEVEIGGGVAID